jgi:UDP-N-acetylglucosamine 2-epimerase (non-hydrolysing)
MTTLYGAIMGRLLGATVAHIESGLRSFDLLHPFPEELNRRATSRIASILYAPGAWAAANLKRGTVVDTGSNTIRDSLAMVPLELEPRVPVPSRPFGIVSLHRFELLNDRRLLRAAVDALSHGAEHMELLFVDHPVTVSAVTRAGLLETLDRAVRRIPRLSFFEFVALMRQARCIVTDSGGSQEESFYVNLPCLVHRKKTERREGLGENVVLSGYETSVLLDFLREPERFRRAQELPYESPSDVIVADLVARGFA